MPRRPAASEPVFFVDRSLGGQLVVEALRAVGATVIAHDDVLPQDTTDVEWLEEAGRRRWIVLTKDEAIRRNPHERAMFIQARVAVFVLANKGLSGQEMAELFARALPGMRKRMLATRRPSSSVFRAPGISGGWTEGARSPRCSDAEPTIRNDRKVRS